MNRMKFLDMNGKIAKKLECDKMVCVYRQEVVIDNIDEEVDEWLDDLTLCPI